MFFYCSYSVYATCSDIGMHMPKYETFVVFGFLANFQYYIMPNKEWGIYCCQMWYLFCLLTASCTQGECI